MRSTAIRSVPCVCALSALLSACGHDPVRTGGPDAYIIEQPGLDASVTDVSTPEGGVRPDFFPALAPAFGPSSDEPLSVQVSASGESLAETGYDYTATPAADQPVFVDGWEVRFSTFLVVLDHVRLNQPGADPTMRGIVGALVAQQDGPWVIDLHKHGTIVGAGGAPETAVPILVLRAPTTGGAFDPSTRYAFSFDTVPANAGTLQNINITPEQSADVEAMIAHGWSELFAGTATYRGRAATAGVDPTFQDYPTVVQFRFGFGAPASYVNCHNPELGDTDTAATRGIQPSATGHVRAQITMHTDHFFWDETNVEGTPLRFDAFAARSIGFGSDAGTTMSVSLNTLAGDLPASLTDALGRPVLDRGAQTAGVTDNAPPPSYAVHGASGMIRDLRDFAVYNARGQGHLNSDGLCFVQPNGPLTD